MERRILVTGGSGQLGWELLPCLSKLGTVLAPARQELDLTSDDLIAHLIDLRPTDAVHAAAATDVERCEAESSCAQAVNTEDTRRVVEACRRLDGWLLYVTTHYYVTTDYVFDGRKGRAYAEANLPAPLNAYGRSKLAGEQLVQTLVPRSTVVRTVWLYGHVGRNFVDAILRKLATDADLQVVTDQTGSPTYAVDLAEDIAQLMAHEVRGLFHLTNSGTWSWFEFAQAIAHQVGADPRRVHPITSARLHLRARRPAYSMLANQAWQALGLPPLCPGKKPCKHGWHVIVAKYDSMVERKPAINGFRARSCRPWPMG